jgi:hypothetical protein
MPTEARRRPLRWTKPKQTGRLGFSPRTAELRRAGETIVTAQQSSGQTTWFWYGLGQNTCARPRLRLEEIKAEVKSFLDSPAGRSALAKEEGSASQDRGHG